MQLDGDQRKAVETTEGPVCINAGPGSGKTFTIVERIAYLIETQHVSLNSVLAITFTNKAAGELRDRILKRCGTPLPQVHTFHSLALKLLQQAGNEIQIATVREQQELSNELAKQFSDLQPKDILTQVRHEKETNVLTGGEPSPLLVAYQNQLQELDKKDFDDLIVDAYALIQKERPEYAYIMVDEYQDTNELQAAFLKRLLGNNQNICIIGDPDQAIYGFRGARRENFFDFTKQYPDTQIIELSNNYRSKPHIVAVANSFMRRSHEGGPRGKIYGVSLENELEEAKYIVKSIRTLTGGLDMNEASAGLYHLGDISVLYRTNAVGDVIEKQFAHANIPHYRVGKTNFFEYPEIREIIERLKQHGHQAPLVEQIKLICNALGLGRHEDVSKRGKEQNARIESLLQRAQSYNHLHPDEARKQCVYEAELTRVEDDTPVRDVVTLMTAHAAKGLEWPVVFVAGVEEGLFPHERNGVITDLEEEKRLLYVAMTRAKEELYLLTAGMRFRFGTEEHTKPSRFLRDLPESLMHHEIIKRPKKEKSPQAKLF